MRKNKQSGQLVPRYQRPGRHNNKESYRLHPNPLVHGTLQASYAALNAHVENRSTPQTRKTRVLDKLVLRQGD